MHKLLGMGKVCYLIFFVNEGNNTASKEIRLKRQQVLYIIPFLARHQDRLGWIKTGRTGIQRVAKKSGPPEKRIICDPKGRTARGY